MDSVSVSKGCFVYKNGAKKADKRSRKRKNAGKSISTSIASEFTDQFFYETYSKTWQLLKNEIDSVQNESNLKTMNSLIEFISNSYESRIDNVLPTAALLTGINQPDHCEQFERLAENIRESLCARTTLLRSRDCGTLKSAIESLVSGFVEESEERDEDCEFKKLRKSQCTMQVLEAWYKSEVEEDCKMVVILPDFECFNVEVLQDFILILSEYSERLSIVLVLGVATAISALHNSLPYHVTSRVKLQIFQIQPASVGLNRIVDEVILSPKCAFHLSGKVFKLLTDIFLFYDFSINGFVQGFKYCLMEHFAQGNVYALCNDYEESLDAIKKLTHEDIEAIRKLRSFRPYVQSKIQNNWKEVTALLTDDEFLRQKLPKLLQNCHKFFKIFRGFIEFLTVLVNDLPKTLLGRQNREVYLNCISSDILELKEFKESWQILSFLSKEEFVSKMTNAVKTTKDFVSKSFGNDQISKDCRKIIEKKLDTLEEHITRTINAGMNTATSSKPVESNLKSLTRQELKDKLVEMSKQDKPISEFTKSITETLDYIKKEIISVHLLPFTTQSIPLIELFIFSDVATVRRNIIGSPRAALHMALNNPQFYLQCECCTLDNQSSLLSCLPDVSIAYKLHLECGRMINLFDWLQAFRSVVDDGDEEQEQIDPKIQARFTRAVAELQFLGFIKSSKQKTDHVARLTW